MRALAKVRVRHLVLLILPVVMTGMLGCNQNPVRLQPVRIVDDAHSGGNALAVSADSRLAASGGWAGRIRLWQLPEGSPLASWQTGHGDLVGLMFLADGKRVLSTGRDGFVRIWESSGRLSREYRVGSAVTALYPGKDANSVILGHGDGRATHWRVDGRRLGMWELSERRITAVTANRSAEVFAAADQAGNVWRWRQDDLPGQLQSPPSYPRSLVFNPLSGELVGSGWFDLFSWPAEDDRLRIVPTAHRGIVNHLQFSGDGRYIASISRQTDSAILLLDPRSGETLAGYKKHALCGQRVALSPDGRVMISNSDDASVRFYRLPETPLAVPAVRNQKPARPSDVVDPENSGAGQRS
jgi:WD40 repeat protein